MRNGADVNGDLRISRAYLRISDHYRTELYTVICCDESFLIFSFFVLFFEYDFM